MVEAVEAQRKKDEWPKRRRRKISRRLNAEEKRPVGHAQAQIGTGGEDQTTRTVRESSHLDFHSEKKKDRNSQSTSSKLERIDTDFRNLIEGYRPGQYIHIQLTDVPCEMINPIYPITERGLPPAEERFGITILSSLGWSFYDFSAFNSLLLPV